MDNEDLNVNIGADPSGIDAGSKVAAAAINKVTKEAMELDKSFKQLRSSLDPMFAAQVKYNESLAALDKLLAEGRISEDEYTKSIERATAALKEQAAAQLKGTAVSKDAIAANKTAAASRVASETAANNAVLASTRATAAAQAAEEARLTVQIAREEKARTAEALAEAKARAAAAKEAALNIPKVNRDASGRFISAEVVAADRAAAAEETANLLRIAQQEDTLAAQRVRNTQRVLTTRLEAARRAAVADQAAADTATSAAAQTAEANTAAAESSAALAAAEETAGAAALAAAEQQRVADAALAEATAVKAKAAAAAAIAQEAEAAAAAKKAEADAAAALAAKQAEKAAAAEALAEERRVAAANRLKAAIDPLYAAQMRYNSAVAEANLLASTGHIDEPTRLKAIETAEKNLTNALKGNTHAVGSNRAAYEGTVLIHEALQHRYSRMTGSLMILGQAMLGAGRSASLFGAIMSPMGIAIGVVVAAIGALTVACYEGSVEQTKLQRALEVTGQYAGMSADEIEQAGKKIGEATNTSANEATASLEQIAESGRVTGDTLVQMGEITERLAQLTGQKSEEIAADMVKMADDPAAAMKRLNEQYHFLIPTQEQHIRDLIEEGNKTEAVAELSSAFNAALKSEQVQLTGLAGWCHNAAVELGNLWAAMKNIGKASTGVSRLKEIEDQVANIDKSLQGQTGNDAFNTRARLLKQRADLLKEYGDITKKIGDDETKTRRSQLSQQADDERAALDALGMSTKTAHAKMLREQQAWRTQAKALLANPMATAEDRQEAQWKLSHAKETDAAIAKRYDKGDMPSGSHHHGPSQVSVWQDQLKQMEEASGNYFKDEDQMELDFWTKKLDSVKKGSKEYISIQSKIYALQKKQAKDSYAAQIEDLKAKIDDEKGDVQGEEAAWQAYLTKVKTVMGETSKEYIAAAKEYKKAEVEIAATQAALIAKAEKAKEQPLARQQEDKTTATQLQTGQVDYAAAQGLLSDRKIAESHKALLAEELQDEEDYENRLHEMRLASLNEELRIPNLSRDKIAEIQVQIEQLEQDHQDRLNTIRNQGLIKFQQDNQAIATAVMQKWNSTADAITQSLGSTFKGALNGSFDFRSAMFNITSSIEGVWVDMAMKSLNAWIRSLFAQGAASTDTAATTTSTHVAAEATKTAATIAGTATRTAAAVSSDTIATASSAKSSLMQIAHAAAVAAANVYKSIAAIPVVGPFLAPAAAAGALFAVIELGRSIFSAEGGMGEVANDGDIYQLHRKEMVLPASLAEPLRQGLRAPSSSGLFRGAAAAGNEARTTSNTANFYYQPKHTNMGASFDELLRKDGRTLRKWVQNEVRNGGLKF